MKITIFRNPNDGFLNYIRSSDGRVFSLPLKDDIVKINEVFDSLENATDYEITSINTTDNVPTYQLCCKAKYPNVFGSQGKKGATGNIGPTGPTGSYGPTPPLFLNAIIVDAVYGDDTTATQFTLMDSTNNPATHKFKTIDAAIASPLANTYTIVVYPGDYTVTHNLATGGTYYFYAGANVNCNIGYPNGLFTLDSSYTGITNVYGYGNFNNDASMSPIISGYVDPVQEINFYCNSITGNDKLLYPLIGIFNINVLNNISARNGSAIYIEQSEMDNNVNVLINVNIIESLSNVNTTLGLISINGTDFGWYGKMTINCNILKGAANNNDALIYFLNTVLFEDFISDIIININEIIVQNTTGNNPVINIVDIDSTTLTINSNIFYENFPRTLITISYTTAFLNSKININGNYISGTDPCIDIKDNIGNVKIRLNGKFSSNSTNTIQSNSNGGIMKLYITGEIINTNNTGIGINKITTTASGTILVFENTKIITAGGLAISAPAGDTVKVIHSLAMNNVSSPVAASINSIVGSKCYTNTGVI